MKRRLARAARLNRKTTSRGGEEAVEAQVAENRRTLGRAIPTYGIKGGSKDLTEVGVLHVRRRRAFRRLRSNGLNKIPRWARKKADGCERNNA